MLCFFLSRAKLTKYSGGTRFACILSDIKKISLKYPRCLYLFRSHLTKDILSDSFNKIYLVRYQLTKYILKQNIFHQRTPNKYKQRGSFKDIL